MKVRFSVVGDGLRGYGSLTYKIFWGPYTKKFHAVAGLEPLGTFETQLEAIQACNNYEGLI